MNTRQVLCKIVILGLLLQAQSGSSQQAVRLNYHGKLLRNDGRPVSGNQIVTFSLYSSPTGGEALWEETQAVNVDDSGNFHIVLGSVTSLPALFLAEPESRYLGIKVGNDDEMMPRFQLTNVHGLQPNGSVNSDEAIDDLLTEGCDSQIYHGTHGRWGRTEDWAPGGCGTWFQTLDATNSGLFLTDDGHISMWSYGNGKDLLRFYDGDDLPNGAPVFTIKDQGDLAVKGRVDIGRAHGAFSQFGVTSDNYPAAIYANGSNGYGTWSVGQIGVLSVTSTTNGIANAAIAGGRNSYAIYAYAYSGAQAGYFRGDVHVTGQITTNTAITSSGGLLRVDDPRDPANKTLSLAAVHSPEMKTVYDGVAWLDGAGEAWVELPGYLDALNNDFRYQLTAIGEAAPNLHIAAEISGNRFRIAGGRPEMKVSWQVTGVRNDPYARANPLKVEEGKPVSERGFYLHPKVYDQPKEKAVEYARNPKATQLLNLDDPSVKSLMDEQR